MATRPKAKASQAPPALTEERVRAIVLEELERAHLAVRRTPKLATTTIMVPVNPTQSHVTMRLGLAEAQVQQGRDGRGG